MRREPSTPNSSPEDTDASRFVGLTAAGVVIDSADAAGTPFDLGEGDRPRKDRDE